MDYINGEFVMRGCEEADALHTVSEAVDCIHRTGFIPLFSNSIPGFSLEECTVPRQWWTDDPETDPWVWRQTLSADPSIAYGKFFGRDELASYRSKKIMDVFELDDEASGRRLMTSEVKGLAGFGKDGGEKNFEGVLTDLQMQTYLIMGEFRQKKNRKGQPYGWHIAVMETPETKWGREFVTSCYCEDPGKSWQRIVQKMKECREDAGDREIEKMLGIRYSGSEHRPGNKR